MKPTSSGTTEMKAEKEVIPFQLSSRWLQDQDDYIPEDDMALLCVTYYHLIKLKRGEDEVSRSEESLFKVMLLPTDSSN